MKNLYYILLLTIFVSCSERVELSLESDEKLQIECVLIPGKEITATLTTVSNFSDIQNIEHPENARIYLLTNIDAPFEFKYDTIRELYYIPISHHTPNPSWKYEIRAHLKDTPDNELDAKTSFYNPSIIEIKTDQIDLAEKVDGLSLYSKFKLQRKLNNPYIELKPFYKEVAADGSHSELLPLSFKGNDEDPLAFYDNKYTEGIYINIDRVEYNDFSMRFSFPQSINKDVQVSDYIYFYCSAISESTYRYKIAQAKHISAITGGISDPVITYSNVNNGYGVFGSSVGRLDSVRIK